MQDFLFQVDTLPYSDVTVVQDDQYLGIILTDDDRYNSSPSAKDVNAYTPALLSRKNWRYHMVFSRNIWKDPDRVESDLMVFVGSNALKKENV